jgi:hypothetical protein
LDTLKKIPGQVRVTGTDLVFKQDKKDLLDKKGGFAAKNLANLVYPV